MAKNTGIQVDKNPSYQVLTAGFGEGSFVGFTGKKRHLNIMKYLLLLTAAVSLVGYSCTDDDAGPSNEEILTQRIEDIIPQEYLDTLEQLGLEIHFGTNPPNVEGSYDFKPSILDTSNIATDMLGQRFLDAVVHLSEQCILPPILTTKCRDVDHLI